MVCTSISAARDRVQAFSRSAPLAYEERHGACRVTLGRQRWAAMSSHR